MNANFALDFRQNQITLLHLHGGEWTKIGQLAVDDPDLDAALGYLRLTAMGLEPQGIAAKLILPDEAILYTTLTNLSLDRADRAAEIAQALVGRTPYAVEDLVYDWTDDGSDAHLSVIARETLDEAAAFAAQHRIHAVSFAAWPSLPHFAAEADFGPTDIGAGLADSAPLPPELAPMDASPPQMPSADDFEMGDHRSADLPVTDIVDPDAATLDAQAKDDTLSQDGAIQSQAEPISDDPVESDDPVDAAAPPLDDLFAQSMVTPLEPSDLDLPPALTDAPQDDAPFAADLAEPEIDPRDADMGHDFALGDGRPVEPDFAAQRDAADDSDDDSNADATIQTVSAQNDEPAADFATVFADEDAVQDADSPTQDQTLTTNLDAQEAPIALDVPFDETLPMADDKVSANKAEALLAAFAARREAALSKADGGGKPTRIEPILTTAQSAPPLAAPNRASAILAVPDAKTPPIPARSFAVSKPSKPKPSKTLAKPAAPQRNSAVLGFILTAILLIALAAAAAMSSYLATAWNSYLAPASEFADQSAAPSIDDELAADAALATDLATDTPIEAPPQPTILATQITPPVTASQPAPEFMMSTSNLVVPKQPALLPQPSGVATPLMSMAPVIDGAVAPDQVVLIAGRPPLVPTPRPDSLRAASPIVPTLRPNPRPQAVASADIYADPALAGKKPSARPETMRPAPPDVAQNTPDPALIGKRPLVRPDSILAAEAARLASAPASLVAQANALVAAEPRSQLAVAISRLPQGRPQGLRPPVIAAAPEIAPPDEPSDLAQDIPLEADNEPEVVASKSSGPRTVVSRNATFNNAINLSRVNLIGVYGGKANRYALVRQSNGRFKKLYVGDRFDGGLVAAITENEMRYSKSGKMIALKMPKG